MSSTPSLTLIHCELSFLYWHIAMLKVEGLQKEGYIVYMDISVLPHILQRAGQPGIGGCGDHEPYSLGCPATLKNYKIKMFQSVFERG